MAPRGWTERKAVRRTARALRYSARIGTSRGLFHRWVFLAGGADSELGDTRASYPAGMTTRPTNGTARGVLQGSTCLAGGTTKPDACITPARNERTPGRAPAKPDLLRRWLQPDRLRQELPQQLTGDLGALREQTVPLPEPPAERQHVQGRRRRSREEPANLPEQHVLTVLRAGEPARSV